MIDEINNFKILKLVTFLFGFNLAHVSIPNLESQYVLGIWIQILIAFTMNIF